MSFLGSIGSGLKKVGKAALPLAGAIPVVGGGIQALSGLLGHHGGPPGIPSGDFDMSGIADKIGQAAGAANPFGAPDGMKPVGGGGIMDKLGGFLRGHGDQLLGAGAIGEGLINKRKANNLSGQALSIKNQSYADRAGLRKLGVQGMMNEQAPDMSEAFAPVNNSNPYALKRVG